MEAAGEKGRAWATILVRGRQLGCTPIGFGKSDGSGVGSGAAEERSRVGKSLASEPGRDD